MPDSHENVNETIHYTIVVPVESLETHYALIAELTKALEAADVGWYKVSRTLAESGRVLTGFEFLSDGEVSAEISECMRNGIARYAEDWDNERYYDFGLLHD